MTINNNDLKTERDGFQEQLKAKIREFRRCEALSSGCFANYEDLEKKTEKELIDEYFTWRNNFRNGTC